MPRAYSQLGLEERRRSESWRRGGVSVDVLAEKLGRHRSTSDHPTPASGFAADRPSRTSDCRWRRS
ncbi:helix-turn-helix domain-containing protein [Acuticoccus sp. I52.16.1]|uniref:helix-turn-helix domain-containing protein n=1 Tax=Acuticoccus sp. I52.16.1 TaxID=2928472 RepID=UPI00352D8A1C